MGAKMDDVIAGIGPALEKIEGTSCDDADAKVGFKIYFYLLPMIHCKKEN